ncbi:MAG: hypothetical protein KF718_27090 [Polyangiaceae bacterium]|nr:hypothetical protein [Polyangiaceae bacterium]
MIRQDYIGRLIQQLGEALARIAKLSSSSQLAEAEAELRSAEEALGVPRGIERFDARSAALLLGGSDKVVLAALLLEQRARLADAQGNDAEGARHRARALALLDHARAQELAEQAVELRARLDSASRR